MIPDVMEPRPIHPLALWAILICLLSLSEAGGQAQNGTKIPKLPAALPPLPAPTGSPIDFFRQLINAQPAEREKLLASKKPELRKILEDYAFKYQALPPDQRELRLRNMELRYHFTSLLYTAPSNRTERLKAVPDRDRPLVEERLKYWDRLSAGIQREVLQNERLTREYIGVGPPKSSDSSTSLTGQTSNQFVRIEEQIIRWQMVPDARRSQIQGIFTDLFELTDAEKAREKLQQWRLSEEERQLMERTLARFKQLTPSQRGICVTNFSRFASLSTAERREFLVNAGEWQKMKPEDREAWRKLVSRVPPMPPLPPGYRLPPTPPGLRPQRPSAITAQNTN
jgi:Protein of unknown function (DUF3106)